MTKTVDILIPTYQRPAALAVTLACLVGQTCRDFDIIIADQSEAGDGATGDEAQAVIRALRYHGHAVTIHPRPVRQGMAEQRQFLLDRATAPYVLFIDDDLVLEPDVVGQMLTALGEVRCGFIGCAVIGLSYKDEYRPHQQAVEFWEGPVQPEVVRPRSRAWERHQLHNAANTLHVQQQLSITGRPNWLYKVAWVGGCALYDTAKLRACGGFTFWEALPADHCGEDVLAQLRVMARFGGAGLLPSGVYHQELPTTVPDRSFNAPERLPITEDRFVLVRPGPTEPTEQVYQ